MIEITPLITCTWIGDGECCKMPVKPFRSYCEKHHIRMYITMYPEMADFIIEKELKEDSST